MKNKEETRRQAKQKTLREEETTRKDNASKRLGRTMKRLAVNNNDEETRRDAKNKLRRYKKIKKNEETKEKH